MTSKPWSDSTKRLVLVGIVLLLGLAIARFSRALAPLLVAVIVAYVLNMPTSWITRHTRIPRKLVVGIDSISHAPQSFSQDMVDRPFHCPLQPQGHRKLACAEVEVSRTAHQDQVVAAI